MLISSTKLFIKSSFVFITLLLLGAIHWPFIGMHTGLIGCFGAAVVLIAINPSSKMASPKALVIGLIMSAAIGVVCTIFVADITTRIILSCSIAMLLMVFLMLSIHLEAPPH